MLIEPERVRMGSRSTTAMRSRELERRGLARDQRPGSPRCSHIGLPPASPKWGMLGRQPVDFLLDYRPLWWRGGALGVMIDGISEQLLLLIGQVYDCSLDPSLWDATLARIAAVIDCRTAALALWNPLDGRLLLSRSAGMSPHELEQMAQYSPEASQMVAAFGPESEDEPHILSRHVPLEYRLASPYVRDCLTPGGIVDVMQLPLMRSPTRRSAIGLGRNQRQGTITD